jgi:hypothetical protein
MWFFLVSLFSVISKNKILKDYSWNVFSKHASFLLIFLNNRRLIRVQKYIIFSASKMYNYNIYET